MNVKLIDSAAYAAKTLFFFLFVGGLVGTVFALPFTETLTHRPFRMPDSLFMMLFGYVLVGMPVAGSAGLLYGIRLALSPAGPAARYLSAAVCGTAPSAALAVFAYASNPRSPADSLLVAVFTMLFTGLSAAATARIHLAAERRFGFFRTDRAEPEAGA